MKAKPMKAKAMKVGSGHCSRDEVFGVAKRSPQDKSRGRMRRPSESSHSRSSELQCRRKSTRTSEKFDSSADKKTITCVRHRRRSSRR